MSRSQATVAVRHGLATDSQFGAVVPPLVLSTNFTFDGLGGRRRYDYTRSGNPTRDLLAEALAELEGGVAAVVTATGMAAVTLVLHLVPRGGLVVAPHDGYGGTWRLLQALAKKGLFELVLADLTDPAARGGAVVAADRALADELAWWANCLGLTGAPFDSYLTLRGVRTLAARLRLHEENAARVASLLAGSEVVERLHWPGLATHPTHALARKQQRGFGAMLSFELPALPGAAEAFVDGLRCFTLAESLGGVESLIAHPATMTHAAMTPEARAAAGISDQLLRLSIGIEGAEDLEADLRAALDRVARLKPSADSEASEDPAAPSASSAASCRAACSAAPR